MSKKDKLGLDKVVSLFNKEFEKTSSQFNKLVSDAFKQLETLQSQVQDPIKKIMEDLDKLRDKEMNRFQSELDKRLNEFHELQSQLLEKLGIEQAKPAPKKTVKAASKKAAPKAKPTAKKAAAKKPAAKKPVTQKPSVSKAKAKISDINGVGPATVKKLTEAGIKEISQIAKPTPQEKKTLEAFNKVKGFSSWQEQATKLAQS
tara:strand:+ start:2792 stop:3400 length:609 start_codon:yes stop_codon:yes gene_type:complete